VTIRTADALDAALSTDLIWRKKELSALKLLVGGVDEHSERHKALLRATTAVLYAHWEGFIKYAASGYAEFVAFQRLRYEELALPFVALTSRKMLRAGSESAKITTHLAVVDFILSSQTSQASLPYKEAINTESNLSSRVLREIVDTLGLDFSPFATKAQLIDETLLKSRNQIAHGEYVLVDAKRLDQLNTEVYLMMDEFHTQVSNAAALKLYKRAA
jgi:hypothetical protein